MGYKIWRGLRVFSPWDGEPTFRNKNTYLTELNKFLALYPEYKKQFAKGGIKKEKILAAFRLHLTGGGRAAQRPKRKITRPRPLHRKPRPR